MISQFRAKETSFLLRRLGSFYNVAIVDGQQDKRFDHATTYQGARMDFFEINKFVQSPRWILIWNYWRILKILWWVKMPCRFHWLSDFFKLMGFWRKAKFWFLIIKWKAKLSKIQAHASMRESWNSTRRSRKNGNNWNGNILSDQDLWVWRSFWSSTILKWKFMVRSVGLALMQNLPLRILCFVERAWDVAMYFG